MLLYGYEQEHNAEAETGTTGEAHNVYITAAHVYIMASYVYAMVSHVYTTAPQCVHHDMAMRTPRHHMCTPQHYMCTPQHRDAYTMTSQCEHHGIPG